MLCIILFRGGLICMKKNSSLAILFTLIMLICVLFVVWYLPAVSQRHFQLEDIQKSLETSLGRERKQQAEYDETVALIPAVEAELERVIPLTEAAKEKVKSLKKERKSLRKEKKELEGSDSSDPQEVTEND